MNKPVIVVVDDHPHMCDLIKRMLSSNYDVHTFTTGSAATEYLLNHHVDLALLDYEMPNMTGYEVLMAIRSEKRIADLPSIFVTGITNPRLETEMLERGADGFILKPLQIDELNSCIEKYLNKS